MLVIRLEDCELELCLSWFGFIVSFSSWSEACCLNSCSVGLFFGAENDFWDVTWEAEYMFQI